MFANPAHNAQTECHCLSTREGKDFVRGKFHFQFGAENFPTKPFLRNLGYFPLFVHPRWWQ